MDAMEKMVVLMSLSLLLLRMTEALALSDLEEPIPITNVQAITGSSAELPCDIPSHDTSNDTYLVLWFKDQNTTPIYALDIGGKPLGQAGHWSNSTDFSKRLSFRTSLVVDNLTLQDGGIYQCRVDYRDSPTKIFKLSLTIIALPDKPVIRDNYGNELQEQKIGPYVVGQDLILQCEVTGGVPAPKVTWWKGKHLLDSTDEVTENGTVVNYLMYQGLQKEDQGAKFACQASNTDLILPARQEVKILLNLKPESVSILSKPEYVTADIPLEVVCQAVGEYPLAKLTWWLGSKQLNNTDDTSYNGITNSTVVLTPTVSDDRRYLTCRAENPTLGRRSAMQDKWLLNVHYSPIAHIHLGLDPLQIIVGHDIYFNCEVKSNPPPNRIEWMLNGQALLHNRSEGVIMSSQSLVLQKLKKEQAGNYACLAMNTEGKGQSQPLELDIKYRPYCAEDSSEQVVAVTAGEQVTFRCQVDANPRDVSFSWFFSDRYSQVEQLGEDKFDSSGLTSSLNFTPTALEVYGELYCIGENVLGRQKDPCAFQIVPTDSLQ